MLTDHYRTWPPTPGSAPAWSTRGTASTTDDRGEGVISAAIVVLIMAFLGVLMWGAFKLLFQNASTNTSNQVDQIGS